MSAKSGIPGKIFLLRSVLVLGIATISPLFYPMMTHAEAFLQCKEPRRAVPAVQSAATNKNLQRAEGLLLTLLHKLKPGDRLRSLPTIQVVNGKTPNAYSLRDSIIINDALFEHVRDDSELAYVLAHELGHIKISQQKHGAGHDQHLRHALVPADNPNCPASEEFFADGFAAELLSSLSMDLQAPVRLLQRLMNDRNTQIAPGQLAQLQLRVNELMRLEVEDFKRQLL